jgi:hypothetical protein
MQCDDSTESPFHKLFPAEAECIYKFENSYFKEDAHLL